VHATIIVDITRTMNDDTNDEKEEDDGALLTPVDVSEPPPLL
jgi:hypothetical protein